MQTLPSSQADKLAALAACRYFNSLAPEILSELSEGMNLISYERGEVVFWQDDPGAGLYLLRKGTVKLFKLSPQGREMIMGIMEQGATFNEVPVFDGGPNPVNVATLDECEMWLVRPEPIRAAMERHPEMCRAVVQNLSKNLRQLVNVIEELSFYQVTNRLARLISTLPGEQLAGEGPRLTQDQIAARLGTVREVVARALRELERSGAIHLQRRQIKIRDHEILAEWAQGPYKN